MPNEADKPSVEGLVLRLVDKYAHFDSDAMRAAFIKRLRERLASEAAPPPQGWQRIATAPRDGTNILLRFGQDGVSQGKFVPGLSHPWKFIDTNDGITWLINHAVDGPGGPSHWQPMPTHESTQ